MLKAEGREVGRRHVATLMKKMGVDAIYQAAQHLASIGRYLSFYNGKRPHSSLGGKTPDQAYINLATPIPAAA